MMTFPSSDDIVEDDRSSPNRNENAANLNACVIFIDCIQMKLRQNVWLIFIECTNTIYFSLWSIPGGGHGTNAIELKLMVWLPFHIWFHCFKFLWLGGLLMVETQMTSSEIIMMILLLSKKIKKIICKKLLFHQSNFLREKSILKREIQNWKWSSIKKFVY